MIRVACKKETYVYNAYHLVKAFYPAQEVSSCVEEKASNYVAVRFPDGSVEAMPWTGEDRDITTQDERERKRLADRWLYKALTARTGRKLSWGILTGVRPTKLAMKSLEAGMSEKEFVAWFMKEYLADQKKALLAWKIAVRERQVLRRLDTENGYSLYVGIPFCPSVCSYCSFSSGALSDWKDRVEDYLDALLKELDALAQMAEGKRLNTIYIGGGTPTTLTAGQLDRLLSCIGLDFPRQFLLEYTVEAGRPDSITKEKLKILKEHGVTRISINPQSMQQKTLDVIGRKHTVGEVCEAYYAARECGFDNINMDLIAGLPGETTVDMEDTLAQIKQLAPDSLTVHSLAVKRAAKMGQEGTHADISPDIREMINTAADAAADMRMSPYYLYRQKNIAGNFENVGYAKVDKAGIYNILIMEEKQTILATGAGAGTKIVLKKPVKTRTAKNKETNLMRLENVKAIDAYINRVDEMIERKGEWLWH